MTGEGHIAASWSIVESAELATVRSFGQWAAANCAAPPTASAG